MHALDPLSADEFRQAAAVLRRDHGVTDRWRFASIELKEPEKGVASSARGAVLVGERQLARVGGRRRGREVGQQRGHVHARHHRLDQDQLVGMSCGDACRIPATCADCHTRRAPMPW